MEKSFLCIFCKKVFSDKYVLKRHTLTHSEKRPHSCAQCNKSFLQSSYLQTQLVHTGERPYNCTVCLKSYNNINSMKEHALRHSGEKPHKCKQCNYATNVKTNLIRHILMHNGEKPYPKGSQYLSESFQC